MTRRTEKLIHAALRDGCREHCDALIDELRRLANVEAQRAALLEALQNTKHYEAPPGFVLNPDYLVPELRAQRDALLEALKPMIDLAEFWINHRQERRVSEEQYNVWMALGHESTAMLKARAAIKAVEEAG